MGALCAALITATFIYLFIYLSGFVSIVVRTEADRVEATTKTESHPCNLNENNIVKMSQWRSGYIARNTILHSGPLCPSRPLAH